MMAYIPPKADELGHGANGLSDEEDYLDQQAKVAERVYTYLEKLHLTYEEEFEGIITGELFKRIEQECGVDVKQFGKYFGILRKNEAPMCNLFCPGVILGLVADAPQHRHGRGDNNELLDTQQKRDKYRRTSLKQHIDEWLLLKHIYDQINPDKQDENTGRSILADTKNLINQMHDLINPIIEQIIHDPLVIREIPEYLLEKIGELEMRGMANLRKYGLLPIVVLYYEIGVTGTIGKPGNRVDWFKAGKPTPKEWFERWGLTPPEEA
ncbi:MAG: hypothetical protein WC805_02690 [Patescibacteria group bacterium]|jgi:hypothetical protein